MSKVLPLSANASVRIVVEKEIDANAYREFVFRLALSITGHREAAEDVAQDVVLRIHKSRLIFARVDNREAWIRKVATRIALNYLRRNRPTADLPESLSSPQTDPEQIAVYQTLARLSAEHRAVLGLAMGQGLSYGEISAALGIPAGTVASRLNSARAAFQKEWEK